MSAMPTTTSTTTTMIRSAARIRWISLALVLVFSVVTIASGVSEWLIALAGACLLVWPLVVWRMCRAVAGSDKRAFQLMPIAIMSCSPLAMAWFALATVEAAQHSLYRWRQRQIRREKRQLIGGEFARPTLDPTDPDADPRLAVRVSRLEDPAPSTQMQRMSFLTLGTALSFVLLAAIPLLVLRLSSGAIGRHAASVDLAADRAFRYTACDVDGLDPVTGLRSSPVTRWNFQSLPWWSGIDERFSLGSWPPYTQEYNATVDARIAANGFPANSLRQPIRWSQNELVARLLSDDAWPRLHVPLWYELEHLPPDADLTAPHPPGSKPVVPWRIARLIELDADHAALILDPALSWTGESAPICIRVIHRPTGNTVYIAPLDHPPANLHESDF